MSKNVGSTPEGAIMRFLRVGDSGTEQPVMLDDEGRAYSLRSLTTDIDARFLAATGLARATEALRDGRLDALDITGVRIGAPVAQPGAVICVGQNYAAHAAESGALPPSAPIVFFKHPNTVVGPADPVRIPPGSTHTDWEVELAVVIGKRARYLPSREHAADVIAGYAISNDVSERDYQIAQSGGQWSKGKSSETFNPLGPWLVPAECVPDPQALNLRSWVNGEPRQDSSTADMIFDVPHLIWHISQFMVLDPGDVVNTGTPQGVALSGRFPYLTAGDSMTLEIDGLGRQHQRLVDAHD